MATDKMDLNEGVVFDEPGPEAAPPSPAAADADDDGPAAKRGKGGKPKVVEAAPEEQKAQDEQLAAEQLRLAHTYRDMGMVEDAIQSLERAARSSRQRFEAASLLGRLHMERGERAKALDWFERAAEAPAPTADAGRALLYDLADALESIGEAGRALAVFGELDADQHGYRDVAQRLERLSRVQTRG
jgi:tetratricopeptide (TPR) repeat protein